MVPCLVTLTDLWRRRAGLSASAELLVLIYSFNKKGKASSLDIAPVTILNSGDLQPRKWQLTGTGCSTAAQAVAAQSPR